MGDLPGAQKCCQGLPTPSLAASQGVCTQGAEPGLQHQVAALGLRFHLSQNRGQLQCSSGGARQGLKLGWGLAAQTRVMEPLPGRALFFSPLFFSFFLAF